MWIAVKLTPINLLKCIFLKGLFTRIMKKQMFSIIPIGV